MKQKGEEVLPPAVPRQGAVKAAMHRFGPSRVQKKRYRGQQQPEHLLYILPGDMCSPGRHICRVNGAGP